MKRVTTKTPIKMFHGTSSEAWNGIQQVGFARAGDNDSGLGRGVYLSFNINKTNYYRHRSSGCNNSNEYECDCDGGVVIRCYVDVGRQYTVQDVNDPMRTSWQDHGFDSAFAAAGVIGKRPEFCISDPRRVRIDGLECSGNDGWMKCVKCSDMVYSPLAGNVPKRKRKFRCRSCKQ